MEEIFTKIETYGYIAIFLYSLGGGFIGLMAGAVLAFAGKLDLGVVMLVAFISNYIGDMLLFYLARYESAQVKPYLQKHRRKLALSHLLMKKYGSWIIVMQKFVYGIKTLIPLAIGLTKYEFKKFGLINLAASVIWVSAVGFGSYAVGESIINLFAMIGDKPWMAPLILFTFAALLWFYLEFATKKKKR